MRKKTALSVLCIIILILAAALHSCLPLSYDTTRRGPAMWIVEDKDGHRCYLFGTVSVGKNGDMYPFADVIEDAYSYCAYLCVETDDTKENGENTDKMFELTDGTTVKDHISEETYTAAVKAIESYTKKAYDGSCDKYAPIYWYSLIYNINMDKCGYSYEYGSDRYFINKAKSDEKPVIEAEGAEKQTETLMKLSDATVDYFISQTLKNTGSAGLDYYDMIYKEGSIDLLAYSLDSGKDAKYSSAALSDGMKDYYKISVTDKNKTLADTVKKSLSEGERVFFAFELSHLVGEDGVISVLQSSGYKVIRK